MTTPSVQSDPKKWRPPFPAPAAGKQASGTLPLTTGAAVKFGAPIRGLGHRVVLYGPGGIGKTTLAAAAPGPVAFFDLDDSLGRLGLEDAQVVEGVRDWATLRALLQAPGWDSVRTLVIDSVTKAEELCMAHVLATVPHEKGTRITSIEDYGYGKGYVHLFEQFLPLLADLDAHSRAGRHVVLICHDCTANVPNPSGADYIRWEPRLYTPSKATSPVSIRLRVREWADHVLFYGYDVAVKDGKGQGGGSRTVYPCELPYYMAKSRTCQAPVPAPDEAFWGVLFNGVAPATAA